MSVHPPLRPVRCLRARGPWRAALPALALVLAASAAQAQSGLNQFSFQFAPGGLSNDGRALRLANWDRDFGQGWTLGASLGWGDVRAADSSNGLFLLGRLGWRLQDLGAVQPRVAFEFGGGDTLGRSSVRDLMGVQAGAAFALSPDLFLSADAWLGRGRFVVDRAPGAQQSGAESRSVRQWRLGIGFRY